MTERESAHPAQPETPPGPFIVTNEQLPKTSDDGQIIMEEIQMPAQEDKTSVCFLKFSHFFHSVDFFIYHWDWDSHGLDWFLIFLSLFFPNYFLFLFHKF